MASLAQNPITPPNTICSDSEPQKMLLESSIRFLPLHIVKMKDLILLATFVELVP